MIITETISTGIQNFNSFFPSAIIIGFYQLLFMPKHSISFPSKLPFLFLFHPLNFVCVFSHLTIHWQFYFVVCNSFHGQILLLHFPFIVHIKGHCYFLMLLLCCQQSLEYGSVTCPCHICSLGPNSQADTLWLPAIRNVSPPCFSFTSCMDIFLQGKVDTTVYPELKSSLLPCCLPTCHPDFLPFFHVSILFSPSVLPSGDPVLIGSLYWP